MPREEVPGGTRWSGEWVRVWFGSHVLAEHHACAAEAARYAAAMELRFAGLRVTNEPDDQEVPVGRSAA